MFFDKPKIIAMLRNDSDGERALINLSAREAASLETLLTTTDDVRQLRRAQALLWLDEGDAVDEVAARLRVARQTVYNWAEHFQERSGRPFAGRVADAERCGRPRTALGIIDPLIEVVIESDPRQFGYQSTIWTAVLLQDYLAQHHRLTVSTKSVSRALTRLEIAWKRPRHRLALRDPYWRQAKGGSKVASGRGRARSS
jgi:transposase